MRVHASRRRLTAGAVAGVALGVFAAAGAGSARAASSAPTTFAGFARAAAPPLPHGWPRVVRATKTRPTTVVPGVLRYSESFRLPHTRERATVLTVDLHRAGVRVGVVAAHDRVINPKDEKVTAMAARTGAVAGVNGDYFDIHADGAPWGAVMVDGALLKSPTPDHQATLTIDADGTAHVGQVSFAGTVTAQPAAPDGSLRPVTHVLYSLDTVPDAAQGKLTELTPALGADPLLPAGLTLAVGAAVPGGMTVETVESSPTAVPALPAGDVALLAGRKNGTWLRSLVPGQTLALTSSLSDPHARAMLGGPAVIVRDGAVYTDPTGHPDDGEKNPETMVGVSRNGRTLMLAVIDGRAPGLSAGVTVTMAAQYLVAHGAWSGILLDGGGSATIVARTTNPKTHRPGLQVLNRPSDSTGQRPVGDGLFVYDGTAATGEAVGPDG